MSYVAYNSRLRRWLSAGALLVSFLSLGGLTARAETWVHAKTETTTVSGSVIDVTTLVDKDHVQPGWIRFKWVVNMSPVNAGFVVSVAGYVGTGKGPGSNTDFFTGVYLSGGTHFDQVYTTQIGQHVTAWESHTVEKDKPNGPATSYAKIFDWEAQPPAPGKKKIQFKLPANTGKVTVQWVVTRDDTLELIAERGQFPGAKEYLWVIDGLPEEVPASAYTLRFYLPGLSVDDEGRWIKVGVGEESRQSSDAPISASDLVDSGTPPESTPTVSVPTPTKVPSEPPAPPGTGGAVWRPTPPLGGGGLSDDVFREGIDKLVAVGYEQLGYAKASADVAGAIMGAKGQGDAATGNSTGQGAQAKADAAQGMKDAREVPNFTAPEGSGGAWVITWPGVASIDLDPMAQAEGATVAGVVRAAIAWVAIFAYQWWLWGEFRVVYQTVLGVQQAKGNPVIGGTGAQATALLAAITISGIILSVPGLFWALADSGLSFGGSMSSDVGAAISAPPSAKYLFTLFVPTGTLAAIAVQVFFVRKGGLVLIAGVQAAIRFVVP